MPETVSGSRRNVPSQVLSTHSLGPRTPARTGFPTRKDYTSPPPPELNLVPGELRGYKNGTNRLMKFQPEKPDPKYWEYLIDDESDLAWAEWLYYKLPTPYWKVNVVIVEEVAGKRNASKIALCKVAHYRNEAPTKDYLMLQPSNDQPKSIQIKGTTWHRMDIVNECLQSIAEDRRNFYTSRQIYIQDSRGLYKEYNNKVEKRNDGSRVRKNAVLAMVKFDIQRADLVRMAGAENLKGLALGHVSNVKTATARAFIREYMKNRANR